MKNLILSLMLCSFAFSQSYLDPSMQINQRITDLLSRMTLEEKVGQMCQYVGIEHLKNSERNLSKEQMKNSDAHGMYPNLHSSDLIKLVEQGLVGSFLHIKNLEEANYLQNIAAKSRLKIPLIFGIDAIHGNALQRGYTVYPTPITLASTWDRELVEKISIQTAKEMRAAGMHWTFTPNIDIARDARWGRVGETFGEDPYLVSELGVASVIGFQQRDFTEDEKVIACIKHLIAGGEPVNGLNVSPMDVSERELREIHLPSYKAAIDAGAFSIMTAHNELNGVPCHANSWLVNDIIRNEFGFKGFVVSDWMDIERLYTLHKIAESPKEASYLSVKGGVDMHMHGPDYLEHVVELVKEGRLYEKDIDNAVSKILEAKFKLGLFENSIVKKEKHDEIVLNNNHKQTALEAARNGIVLLKNDNLLPLNKTTKVFVTGPNANNQTILGDWAVLQPEENITTIYEGIKTLSNGKVSFLDCGEDFLTISDKNIKLAGKMAKKSDVAVVVVGETSLRNLWNTKTCGENTARNNIKLVGKQLDLVKAIQKTGIPTIVVLVNGRPLGTTWIDKHCDAIIETWEPGMKGGEALAEILFGDINPSGKLPITIPRNVGQLQMIYNHKPSQYFRKYYDDTVEPLYPFGFGLSYTKFKYSDLKLEKKIISKDEPFKVSVKVKNRGNVIGDEIVQLYIRDEYSSVTRPVKELKDFKRITLKQGEEKIVEFMINPDKLAFYNIAMKKIVEPGAFQIMVGSSSLDGDLQKVQLIVN